MKHSSHVIKTSAPAYVRELLIKEQIVTFKQVITTETIRQLIFYDTGIYKTR